MLYNVDATSYTSEVQKIKDAKPDAIVLISFDEATKIIPAFESAGIGPKDVQTYFTDGNTADYSKDLPKGTLDRRRRHVLVPSGWRAQEADSRDRDRLKEIDPKLKEFTYGPESYDATIMTASGGGGRRRATPGEAIAVRADQGLERRRRMQDVRRLRRADQGRQGHRLQGVSGPVDLNDTGSPSKGTIGINEYAADNKYRRPTDYITGVVE